MIKIRALRQFSHYHAGNFDQFEQREVDDDIANALVGMELAEVVDAPAEPVKKPLKKEPK
ncbi:hypothetical protein [Pseudomonas ovata]|uniref:hypothetical protein n=1 Tax=Pseudomonas ovata TaxID=1839709 RepID=UPI000D696564|nr:hypothetical protein [Pseudomonas ovata]